MLCNETKEYLLGYRLSLAKIGRLREMMNLRPDEIGSIRVELLQTREECNRIEREIDAVRPAVLSELLAQKYLCGRSLEEISDTMGYSKRQLERLHKKAIESFERQ